MPYKDPVISKQKARERGKARRECQRRERILAGLPADGRGKHGNTLKGSAHYRWNPGRMISTEGYVLVRVSKDHPLANQNGYAYEHRLVMSEMLGRPLKDNELVHHRNGNKQDNSPENLELTAKGAHSTHHNSLKERDEVGRFKAAGCLLDGKEHKEVPF